MQRYIDVAGLIDKLAQDVLYYRGDDKNAKDAAWVEGFNDGIAIAMQDAIQVPRESVIPLKHVHWEIGFGLDPKKRFVCAGEHGCRYLTAQMSNYCPYCGAVMDEEWNDEDSTWNE